MRSVLLELYNIGKQFNVVLTTTVEFKVNKLLDYKTHAQKLVLTIFIMSSSQALVSDNFCLPRYYIYYKVRNRSFVKNLGQNGEVAKRNM
jgi:hypothetical protein